MFAVQPYSAKQYVARVKDGHTTMAWEPCQVIGIDASRDEPEYLVEVRSGDGEFYLERASLIRKCP